MASMRMGAVEGGGEGLGGADGIGEGVDAEALDAVSGGAFPEFYLRGVLFADGGRVGVAVVFDDEDDGEGEEGGEVKGFVDVAGGRAAVAEEGEAEGGEAGAALGVGAAGDVGDHGAEMGNHRQGAIGNVAVVDVALAGEGGAVGVGEVLVKVFAEVAAPDEVSAEVAVGEGDDVDGFVGEEGERDDEGLVALAAGDGALHEALAKEFQNAVVHTAREGSPGVDAEQGVGRGIGAEFVGAEVAVG
jgi:hypothetical protein